ncbi:MAG TPA: cell division protein ZapA [Bacteriovoracaceae bacterium]|nr:cell division protein ZapA [Bacteriovoracaceae bacterium]
MTYLINMTQSSQEVEFSVLGCKVKYLPEHSDSHVANAVVNLVESEIRDLKTKRPLLRDTDVAVLVALKIATDKLQLEGEYKKAVLTLEESLESALQAIGIEAN